MWRTWRTLLADLGDDRVFWTDLLRGILDHRLTKDRLLAVIAAMADFNAHHRPVPPTVPTGRPVLVLTAAHDRAFARQAGELRSVYPDASFHRIDGPGHGALFTHTDAYLALVGDFLGDGR